MTKEEYKKLNRYLNMVFNVLEYNDSFLIKNAVSIDYSIEELLNYCINDNIDFLSKENNMTFMDIYRETREIIMSISPKYVEEFDKLLNSGVIDFSYDNEYTDSEFIFYFKNKVGIININRRFNYNDVVLLIHEFFHYLNSRIVNRSENTYLFTEFISIYFEIYSINYLKKKGISNEEINSNDRLRNLSYYISSYREYCSVIVSFAEFGDIDDDAFSMLNKYIYNVSKENFDADCKKLLDKFEQIEKKYIISNRYEKEIDNTELALMLAQLFQNDYRYIFCTVLAFYAIEECELSTMIYLNDNINSYAFSMLNSVDLLNRIGINLNDKFFIDKVVASMYKFIHNGKQR